MSAQDDGRAIAEAILFGSGVHADAVVAIPALASSQQVAEVNESAAAQETIVAVLDSIGVSDPDVYVAVHTGLRSGDPYAAEAALTRLSDAARSAIANDNEPAFSVQRKADITPNSLVAVIVAVIHVLAFVTAGNAAIFANAVAGANFIWTENWGTSISAGERPVELIGDLTQTFAE